MEPPKMPNIYDQHAKAFANVSAYIVARKGERIASVAFKHGARCTCYFHIIGTPMAKGWADGGGYDKASAAAHSAIGRIDPNAYPEHLALLKEIASAVRDAGNSWDRDLRDAGFDVWQAV
jgi:hypothetical protein